jgi:hypothetical protein
LPFVVDELALTVSVAEELLPLVKAVELGEIEQLRPLAALQV